MSDGPLARLQALRAVARRRAVAAVALALLPWAAVAVLFAALWGDPRVAGALALVGALLCAALALRAWRRVDWAMLVRRIDAAAPTLEDSAGLLLADADCLPPLARLQRERIAARLAQAAPEVRAPWPRALRVSIPAAVVVAAAAWLLPSWPRLALPAAPAVTRAAAPAPVQRLAEAWLDSQAPAYTGLPPQHVRGLDTVVAAGSTLRWQLRTTVAARALALEFQDGRVQPLVAESGRWTGARTVDALLLYRVRADGRPLDARWHRIGVRADRPPRLRVLQPAASLTLLARAQPDAMLELDASDDYGLGAASLELTLAQGSGENIQVSTRQLALAGVGSATTRHFRRRLDLRALGFAQGDDLVLRVRVADRRAPTPQVTRSAAFILRWPASRGADATGVEGLVTRTLPAYFRSQRQIIIDTEALLAQRGLAPPTRVARSDAIGVDQRILRLRYGQFLGEESEGGGAPATPTTAATPSAPTGNALDSVVAPPASSAAPAAPAAPTAPAQDAAHAAAGAAVGDANALVAAFGDMHDEPEAATLLDADTRAVLKSALDAMWLAEGELRTGHPERAVPHEYRALRLVKRVQQASRIYLARVGLALPPVDASRRLTGKREGIAAAHAALARANVPAPSAAALALWRALAPPARAVPMEVQQDFAAWMQPRLRAEGGDDAALALFEAFADWRAAPACVACAARLRTQLWPWLPVAPPALPARTAPDASGRRYLDALSGGIR